MVFYDKNIVDNVRKMRIDGFSTKEITDKLNVPKDAVLRWCFDIKSNEPSHLKYLDFVKKTKNIGRENLKSFSIDKEKAKVLAALVYWCEGYKYPGCNCVGFSNSDINLVKTFLYLFRKGFELKENKFRVHLQMHTTHNKKEIISFWSDSLNIPEGQFHKPTITRPMAKMKRIGYKGTCTVKYYDSALYNEIVGTYEAFFRKYLV